MVLGITHAAIGLVTGTLLMLWYGNDISIIFFTLLGALIPDIDHPTSLLGRYVKPIGYLARHRGFFHSLFAAALITGLTQLLLAPLGVNEPYAIAFFIGYLSHLFFDAITKEGIQPFYPAKQRIQGRTKVGSIKEWLFTIFLTAFLLWYWLIK